MKFGKSTRCLILYFCSVACTTLLWSCFKLFCKKRTTKVCWYD